MNRTVLSRLLETFFRRWFLFLIPVALIVGLGALSVSSSEPTYNSGGVLTINPDTLLSNLADVSIDERFGFETPARATSRRINDLMTSTGFALDVAEEAGLIGALQSGLLTIDDVRAQVSARPVGDNLVNITATTGNPEVSFRLAQAAIDVFIDRVVESDLSQSRAAAEFYRELADGYSVALEEATVELDAYVRENPAPTVGERPIDDQRRLDRLTAAADVARDQFLGANEKAEDARLVEEQTRLDIDQRIRIVDTPEQPRGPQPQLREQILTTALVLVAALIVLVGLVAIATALDQSVRDREDLLANTDVPVLASLPATRRRRTTRKKRTKRRKKDSAQDTASDTDSDVDEEAA